MSSNDDTSRHPRFSLSRSSTREHERNSNKRKEETNIDHFSIAVRQKQQQQKQILAYVRSKLSELKRAIKANSPLERKGISRGNALPARGRFHVEMNSGQIAPSRCVGRFYRFVIRVAQFERLAEEKAGGEMWVTVRVQPPRREELWCPNIIGFHSTGRTEGREGHPCVRFVCSLENAQPTRVSRPTYAPFLYWALCLQAVFSP